MPHVLHIIGVHLAEEAWVAWFPRLCARIAEPSAEHVEQHHTRDDRDDEVGRLRTLFRKEKQKRKFFEQRLEKANKRIAALEREKSAQQLISAARLSAWQGIALAFRRAASNVAARRIGICMGFDKSQPSVNRWELKAAACLCAASQQCRPCGHVERTKKSSAAQT